MQGDSHRVRLVKRLRCPCLRRVSTAFLDGNYLEELGLRGVSRDMSTMSVWSYWYAVRLKGSDDIR